LSLQCKVLAAEANLFPPKLGDQPEDILENISTLEHHLQQHGALEIVQPSASGTASASKPGNGKSSSLTERCLAAKGIAPEAEKEVELVGISARCAAANSKK
jgi:hypothetical protein